MQLLSLFWENKSREKVSKCLNLKEYRVYFANNQIKQYNVKKATSIHGYNAFYAETACEPKKTCIPTQNDYNMFKGYGHYEIGRRSQWDIHL